MAKTIIADLNGGDAITPDNLLIFKIYGNIDGFAFPIDTFGSDVSDADVTVSAGEVTVVNIAEGLNTSFKISSVDEAGNESILSDSSGNILFSDDFVGTVIDTNKWDLSLIDQDSVTATQDGELILETDGVLLDGSKTIHASLDLSGIVSGNSDAIAVKFGCQFVSTDAPYWQMRFAAIDETGDNNIKMAMERNGNNLNPNNSHYVRTYIDGASLDLIEKNTALASNQHFKFLLDPSTGWCRYYYWDLVGSLGWVLQHEYQTPNPQVTPKMNMSIVIVPFSGKTLIMKIKKVAITNADFDTLDPV